MTGRDEFERMLSLAKAGDSNGMSLIFRTYNPSLLRFLSGTVGRSAEDLAQEVWLSAASRLVTFSGDESQFRSWLFTIARRRTIDHWRATGRRPTEIADEAGLAEVAGVEEPDRLVVQAAIAELTAGLTGEQVEVLLLRVVAGLSVDEVAAIVGKKPGAVRVMQHRILRKLASSGSNESVTP